VGELERDGVLVGSFGEGLAVGGIVCSAGGRLIGELDGILLPTTELVVGNGTVAPLPLADTLGSAEGDCFALSEVGGFVKDGDTVGSDDGGADGIVEGTTEGEAVGSAEGSVVGFVEGTALGDVLGSFVGL